MELARHYRARWPCAVTPAIFLSVLDLALVAKHGNVILWKVRRHQFKPLHLNIQERFCIYRACALHPDLHPGSVSIKYARKAG